MKNDIPADQLKEMRKQAYFDAYNSARSNADRHRNHVDPILQRYDNYVT